MSRRTECALVIDLAVLKSNYDSDDRRKLMVLIRRMHHLQDRLLDGDGIDPAKHHDASEYAALHFVLEEIGVVRFEGEKSAEEKTSE